MNISELSVAELKDLLSRIPKEIERRAKEERRLAIKELEALAAQRGFELSELLSEPPVQKERAIVAIKFRNPSDASLTWTGRGRQPKWISDFLQNGGTLEQIRV